jgi:hypothetical protein
MVRNAKVRAAGSSSSSGSPRSGDHLADGSAIVDFFHKVKKGRRHGTMWIGSV